MANISKSIRNKRFRVKSTETPPLLVLQTGGGDLVEFVIKNASLNGIAAEMVPRFEPLKPSLELNQIVDSAKITFGEDREYGLGRLVIRRAPENGGRGYAFSMVDMPVPVDTFLGKVMEIDLSKEDWTKDYELGSDKFNLGHFIDTEYQTKDLFEKMKNFSVFLKDWKRLDKYGYHTVREPSKGPRVTLSRPRKGGRKDYIIMGSNDYLGLSSHPKVIEAAKQALDQYGFGSTGSSVTTGITDLHERLCTKLAQIHGRDKALLYNSGYSANVGIISSLCFSQDLIVADQLCHASLQDGMKMSPAQSRFFRHNDADHLRRILERDRDQKNGALVITEGVFSMDGDSPNLTAIHKVAREFDCRVMVDQAHDFGVLGPNGLGICEKHNLLKETDVIMGTFSKICGGIGGFAVGNDDLIDWLYHFSRAYLFSVSIPPSTAAAALQALELFSEDKSLLKRLRENVAHFKANLESLGYTLPPNHESCVIPVIIANEKKLGIMYQSLLDDGVYCVPIIYPAVSRTNSRFRFTIMANHTASDIDYATNALEKAMLKADFKFQTDKAV